MKTKLSLSLLFAGVLSLFGGPAQAELLNVILGTPLTFFLNGSANGTNFDAATSPGRLTVTGSLINTDFGSGPLPGSGSVSIDIRLSSSGVPSSGISTNDFEMTGTVGSFSGLLLKGKIFQFGFNATLQFFDFRFTLTPGGLLDSFFTGKDIGVTVAMEASQGGVPFTGSFTNNFNGGAKGFVGPIPPTEIPFCPPGGFTSGGGTAGALSCSVLGNGDVRCFYNQSTNLNDNSYGVNAVGWGTKGHKFTDLVGSDKAQFIVKDAAGNVVANFFLDYISTKTGTPSGFASLGPFGGDGSCISGCSNVLSWNSTLAHNLNDHGFCTGGNCTFQGVNLLVNSPPVSPPNTYNLANPAFNGWDFTDGYEFTIKAAAFGTNGFCSVASDCVSIPFIHNSPAKTGSNQISPGPCPPPPQCETCAIGYPFSSTNPRTSVVFNENGVLAAFSPSQGCIVAVDQTIKVWATDETAPLLGVKRVIVKDGGTTTTDYPFSSFPPQGCTNPAKGSGMLNPDVGTTALTGDQAGTDVNTCSGDPNCGRPVFPALFLTDISLDPLTCQPGHATGCGDWQFGGSAIAPHAVFGTWKGAIRTVDKTHSPPLITVTPENARNVPAQNGWNLDSGDPVPAGTPNLGYGTEFRWDVSQLNLAPEHQYRVQVIVHDGDQNKSGGDVGEACVNIRTPTP